MRKTLTAAAVSLGAVGVLAGCSGGSSPAHNAGSSTKAAGFAGGVAGHTPSPAPRSPSSSAAAGGTAGCDLAAPSSTVPTSTPTDTTWALFHGTALPTTPHEGPCSTANGVAVGFAHTPLGAVEAYLQIGARVGQSDEAQVRQVEAGMADQDHAYWVQQAKLAVAQHVVPERMSQVQGFKVVSYTPQTATIQIASAGSTTADTFGVATGTMVWQHGDWKFLVSKGQRFAAPETTVSSLDGFIPWSGVSS